jgi:hypothetical protein
MKSNNEKFLQINYSLLSVPIKHISSIEKQYISLALSFQNKSLKLTASNQYIADMLGITLNYIKKLNKDMNKKFDFFNATQNEIHKGDKKYSSSHIILINETKLVNFIESLKLKTIEDILKESVEDEVTEEPIQQIEEIIPVKIEVIIQPVEEINNNQNDKILYQSMKRETFKEIYAKKMRFAKHLKMDYATFKEITNHYFNELGYKIIMSEIDKLKNIDDVLPMLDNLLELKKNQIDLVESN